MNKAFAGNISSRSSNKPREDINFLDHEYTVKYFRKICPIIKVINKFKNIDSFYKKKERYN